MRLSIIFSMLALLAACGVDSGEDLGGGSSASRTSNQESYAYTVDGKNCDEGLVSTTSVGFHIALPDSVEPPGWLDDLGNKWADYKRLVGSYINPVAYNQDGNELETQVLLDAIGKEEKQYWISVYATGINDEGYYGEFGAPGSNLSVQRLEFYPTNSETVLSLSENHGGFCRSNPDHSDDSIEDRFDVTVSNDHSN